MIKQLKLWALLLILILILILARCIGDHAKWKYRGSTTINQIIPAVGGEMRVNIQNSQVYLFDRQTPAHLEFIKFDPERDGANAENYQSRFKEAWMNNSSETLNRYSVRLVRGIPDGPYQILFNEYAQNGYWWTSDDLKSIYILVEWSDFTSKDVTTQLSFWKSTDGGDSFQKTNWSDRGNSDDLLFDSKGQHGYILTGNDSLWQTHDGGDSWNEVRLQLPQAEDPLPFRRYRIDSALVSPEGNLLIALYHRDKNRPNGFAAVYLIPANTQQSEAIPLSPLFELADKRILSIANATEGGLYLMHLNCQEQRSCTWPELKKRRPPIYFSHYIDYKLTKEHAFSRFLPVEQFIVGQQGLIYIIAKRPDGKRRYSFVSKNNGENWQETNITNEPVAEEYIDKKTNEHWQYRFGGDFYSRVID